MRRNSGSTRIIRRPTLPAKGEIVGVGIPLREIARAAGIAPSTLSDYLGGRLRNVDRRLSIYHAFCRLSGRRPTSDGFAAFWERQQKGCAA